MQDGSHQRQSTNPMDYQPELSQSSYPDMGFEGDAGVCLLFDNPSDQSAANEDNTPTGFETTGWAHSYLARSTEDAAPLVFDPTINSGRVTYDPQTKVISSNIDSGLHPTPGFVGYTQYTFTQPLASDGFKFATENFPPADFNTTLTSTPTDFPPLAFDTASPASFQSYGAQDTWSQNAPQNDANGFSWGQSINGPPLNPTFQPLNPDQSFVDAGFDFPTAWSPDTSTDGYFQQDVVPAIAAPSTQWNDSSVIWGPAPSAASMNGTDLNLVSSLTTSTSTTPPPQPATLTSAPRGPSASHQCNYPRCTKTFTRDYERIRHEASVHRVNRRRHLCHIVGCSKSQGIGYSRSDKLTEHLWKKHADLGYAKAW